MAQGISTTSISIKLQSSYRSRDQGERISINQSINQRPSRPTRRPTLQSAERPTGADSLQPRGTAIPQRRGRRRPIRPQRIKSPCQALALRRRQEIKKARSKEQALKKQPGDTYFRGFSTIIGSKRLAFVFGKGTRVSTWIWSPENLATPYSRAVRSFHKCFARVPSNTRFTRNNRLTRSNVRPLVPVS